MISRGNGNEGQRGIPVPRYVTRQVTRQARGSASRAGFGVRGQQRQRCGGHALDPPCLAESLRSDGDQLVAAIRRTAPADRPIIEALGQAQNLVAAEAGDILRLPVQIDGIFGIDLDLRGGLGVDAAELRPDAAQNSEIDLRESRADRRPCGEYRPD